jgi:chorismate mutase/prephenate dehydratase
VKKRSPLSRIGAVRARVDALDDALLKTLAKRRKAVVELIREKAAADRPVRDLRREEKLLARVIRTGRAEGLDSDFVRRVYEEILDDSVRAQERRDPDSPGTLRVAFQGIEGAYSELAARRYFTARKGPLRLLGRNTFAEAAAAVDDGQADYAILPVENTTAGSINEVYDLLSRSRLRIVGEEILPVSHCLLAVEKVPVDKIRRVLSHPQALTQCMRFLSTLRHCVTEYFTDTAMAVRKVAEDRDIAQAAIASEEAGRRYGLKVLKRDLADQKDNFTRFVVVAHDAPPPPRRARCKTSIVMATAHKEGALLRALNRLHEHKINLTKLESRPEPGKPFQYRFFVDFEGRADAPEVSAALAEVRRETAYLKILGSYPSRRRR